jgi:hypothetical protein
MKRHMKPTALGHYLIHLPFPVFRADEGLLMVRPSGRVQTIFDVKRGKVQVVRKRVRRLHERLAKQEGANE